MSFVAVFILAIVFIVLCPNTSFAEPNQTIMSEEQKRAVHMALEGEWICDIGSDKIRLHLTDDSKFSLKDKEGHYLVDGTKLTLKSGSSQAIYDFELAQNQLTLSGGDLNQALKFTKLLSIGRSKKWLSAFSVKSLQTKCYHILSIVIVVILCRIVLILFRTLIRFIIYSDWGPLRFVYRQHKSRTMTIYSLVANIAKYIVYLLALGFALSELGVNYKAYFASLSVIGLAIGFGSQGLVQDMVTGFFIIFES
ncbi:MAG: mechanosensitive ion channel family protein [Planctomycetota bacterium]